MPKSLAQIQKQIAKLEQEADGIRKREVGSVIARMKEAIAFYGITAAELGLGAGASGRGRKPAGAAPAKKRGRPAGSRKTARVGKIKFRDDQGNTWTGHGRRPKWYTDAIAAGKTAEQLAA